MSEPLPDLDLKFLPEWLKEGPKENQYADYRGESPDDRRGGDRGRGGPGGPRRDGPGGRGPRPPGGGGGGGQRREGGGPPRPGGARPGQGRGGDRRDAPRRDERPRVPTPPPIQVEVRVEFLPEPNGANGIARQVKGSSRAYPLFGTGRLFLDKPERHRVRITSVDPTIPLYQIGDGPISPDRATIERNAFRNAKDHFYKEEVVQGEPIKGNFTNVARSRTGGVLLGPTNYHAYQPALRRLFEERFSRRMSFTEFLGQEIQIVTDEQSINDWKEQARSTTTYVTTQEAEPITFKTAAEAEQHFRQHYLAGLLKSGYMLECSGQSSRILPDRMVTEAVRDTWEREYPFPQGLINNLRPYLVDAGLHFFKHRKRVLFVSAIRPIRHAAGQDLSSGIAAILNAIEEKPRCTRRDLAVKILGENHEAPEVLEQKAALARDLHYLIHAGHVIEFHDGALDLPIVPGAQPHQQPTRAKSLTKPAGGQGPAAPVPVGDLSGESAEAAPVEGELAPVSSDESLVDGSEEFQAETEEPGSAPSGSLESASDLPEMAELPAAQPESDEPPANVAIPSPDPGETLRGAPSEDQPADVVGTLEEAQSPDSLPALVGSDELTGNTSADPEPIVADSLSTTETPEVTGEVTDSLTNSDVIPVESSPPIAGDPAESGTSEQT